MEQVNFVLAGLGGQGILFMTKILAEAALGKGFKVMGAETHGMAQRGGSVVSHLRLGEVESSLVRTGTARYLIALEENEAYRNLPFLARGGHLFASASSDPFPKRDVRAYLEEYGIAYHGVDAGALAMALGAPLSGNLALLGFFSAFDDGPLRHRDIRKTVERVSPERFKAVNLKVFDAGHEKGLDQVPKA